MTAKNSKTWLLVVFFLGVSELISLPAVGAEKKVAKGLVYGIVTYQDRKPVKGATVYATPLGRPIGAIIPHADSDETGYYAIRIPRSWFGRFAVTAKKEDEDYPNMSWQFYSDGKFQTVTLSASHPEANVIIRLGPKAGVLLGTVADARSNAPLSPCVEFKRAAAPRNFLSASGLVKPTYKLLIPADTDILMQISLDGYRTWYFPGTIDKETQQPVRLKPGEKKAVDIRLVPDETAKTGCPKPIRTVSAR
jgi:hypothetical protein